MVVAWDADDDDLKAAFRAGLDIHSKNAEDLYGATFTRLQGRARHQFRQNNKRAVHATNYLTTARNLAASLGWLVIDAERFMRRWFDLHPAILDWHKRKASQLRSRGFVDCAFGHRRIFYDRPESILPEAVAWTPQATVALVTQYAILALEDHFLRHKLLNSRGQYFSQELNPYANFWRLQVHDSLDFQLTYLDFARQISTIGRIFHSIVVPYPDPLIIPWNLKISKSSWGEGRKCTWDGVIAD